ncbi:Short-chain dehydrogenase/reductase SDR [Lasiodiplodia theobromae]|uniref:Short-chain dehydrogenase/reductase SDR n=1 Tax=Lasiodiplodia theobromae TaxID=45133 RepID=A0A8H7IT13_9PEZI|nr:Short-chain dehydrogenase/reductase SDR [Lasiodiplodia theobromae]
MPIARHKMLPNIHQNPLGNQVAITYVSPSSAALAATFIDTVRALNNGADAIAIQADVAALDSPSHIVDACLAAFGPTIDILINNAGTAGPTPILATTTTGPPATIADYDRIMNLNVRGVFFLTQAVAPHLPKIGGGSGGGRIINIGSTIARKGAAQSGVYAASKAAVEAMTRAWAVELGISGHTVNTVTPGPTETETLAEWMQLPAVQEEMEGVRRGTAMEGRLGKVEEVAAVIVALAEPQMTWVTGQTVSASGGYTTL